MKTWHVAFAVLILVVCHFSQRLMRGIIQPWR